MKALQPPADRPGFLQASGVLLVVREPPPAPPPSPGQPPMVPGRPEEGVEILLALWDDGSANGLSGKVDLGTGVATSLGQLVAEELELPASKVRMVLGDTARAPNQGPTIASATLQIASEPLRRAAAQARAWLVAQGGDAGVLAGRHVRLVLDMATPLKPIEAWRVAGTAAPRVDLKAKMTGQAVYVHDVRLEGMLHGRVLRPPYAGADHGEHIGRTLRSIDRDSVAHIPGLVAVVREGDFVGVVAEREDQAEQAMRELRLDWGDWPAQPPLDDLAQALIRNPSEPRVVAQSGDANQANEAGAVRLQRQYVWPYQLHASIGPSCAVAHWEGSSLTVWTGSQNPHVLRADLARLTGLDDTAVDVIRLEAAGCYGRNGADDVTADAALLSRAVGAPVRVQLTREQEHQWEPKGAAQLMEVDGSLDDQGRLSGWDFQTRYPSNAATTLALLLTGRVPAQAQAYFMGDRTSVPPYRVPNLKVTVHDMAPILRASWLRGVSALPNSFAHECFIDEMAMARGEDPVAFRLRHLDDRRAAELLERTAEKAGWQPHTQARQRPSSGDWVKGQGVAYARYVHSKFPGFGAAWSAWVADVEVNRVTGEVHVSRVVVGQDSGSVVNPAGVEHQVHGNVLQTTSRALLERVQVEPERGAVASREWGSYPILSFKQVPVIEVMLMPRQGEPILGSGESSSVPGTAAIANAIFDATGVRLRNPPFTPEVVRQALQQRDAGSTGASAPNHAEPPAPTAPPATAQTLRPAPVSDSLPVVPGSWSRGVWPQVLALGLGALAATAGLLGWRSQIAPVQALEARLYSPELIERGRQLAAVGNCMGCHTQADGQPYAGGRAIETPFGTVYGSNITPDPQHGIGRWSFSAFQRALREGLSRDGRHLYPAFPYTAFSRMPDEDLMAVYAYLMSQPPVATPTPAAEMRGIFAWRPLMAVWNALNHDLAAPVPSTAPPAGADAALWTRGEYLVNGPGHCGACHTPRDRLGAERRGADHFGGAFVEGWHAPALVAQGRRTLPWTEAHLLSYLREGHSPHGVAVGPMAEVVQGLRAADPQDLRAMAHYLAHLQGAPEAAAVEGLIERTRLQAQSQAPLPDARQRLFESACGACHSEGRAPVELGLNLPLALNGKVRDARPDDLLRIMLDGIRRPAGPEVSHMPGFREALDDRQLADLATWMRARYAPDLPPWPAGAALEQRAADVRGTPRVDR